MGKQQKSAIHKKPPAVFRKMRKRRLGQRSLYVICNSCDHHMTFNVDEWPDELLVPSFGRHIACSRCGHLGASVRPDWTQLRGVPATLRR
jgi:hypothetical protein